jgi:adenosylmethionine-8-amino-7-oxononanoate aminotransferase
VSDRVVEPFVDTDELFLHGLTFGGHPVSAAVAHANIDLIEREQLCARVRDNEQRFRATLDALRDIPIVGDVRGAGAFWVVELVRDQATKESFTPDESARILKGVVSRTMFEHGLICRADDRAEPVVVLSPPLIAGGQELDVIGRVLRRAFEAGAAELRALTR